MRGILKVLVYITTHRQAKKQVEARRQLNREQVRLILQDL